MSEAIVVALITGGMSLAGVVITSMAAAKKAEKATAVAQATETRPKSAIQKWTRTTRMEYCRREPKMGTLTMPMPRYQPTKVAAV